MKLILQSMFRNYRIKNPIVFSFICVLLNACSLSPKDPNTLFFVKHSKKTKVTIPSGKSYGLSEVDMSHSKWPWTQSMIQGDWNQVVTLSSLYLREHPYDPEATTVLSQAYLNLENIGMAEFFVNQALESHPEHAAALNQKGLVIINQSKSLYNLERAIGYFQKSIHQDSQQYAARLNLAYSQLLINDFQKARMGFKKVAQMCHNCSAALSGLALAEIEANNIAESAEILEKVTIQDPNDLLAFRKLIEIYSRSELKIDKLRSLYRYVLKKNSNNRSLKRELAFLNKKIKKLEEADRQQKKSQER